MDASLHSKSDAQGPSVLDRSLLVSLIVVFDEVSAALEGDIKRAASTLRERHAFFELLLIGNGDISLTQCLVRSLSFEVPHVRFLQVADAGDFDRAAMHGYHECIGDVVILSSSDEIGAIDLAIVLEKLSSGAELVRLRRKRSSLIERTSSWLVRGLTGLEVDTRFQRTLGVGRQFLGEMLAYPEELHLFRFTVHGHSRTRVVIETHTAPSRSDVSLILRRVDLVARLIATSAPRLLRAASIACLVLSALALLSLLYVVGVWLLRNEIAEGWTTMFSFLAGWMFVQSAASAILCLGLSRLLDRQERSRPPRLIKDVTVSDLFSDTSFLNVEGGHEH
ncbi:glucosyl transferase [Aureimonas altamirensis]|uniref:glucosyl transferase n=1 Tax=Aureimonas altamirensis TaxID=370622 RepID=UPI002036DC62|nr:glucosyl transferase [Aureimonas altamirensis]MCM2505985.1 glucosyl transferase [Aureimonas altamirensis]